MNNISNVFRRTLAFPQDILKVGLRFKLLEWSLKGPTVYPALPKLNKGPE